MSLPLNYEFVLQEVKKIITGNIDNKILDYGCGKGRLVEVGDSNGIDFYGVELFSHGSGLDIKQSLKERNILNSKVYEMSETKIPFPDNTFDMVVSNTVFEHIPDISVPLAEIYRVLKDEGIFLNLYPHKGTIREGHCHIPYAHRLPTKSKIQYYWLYAFKLLGLGRRKKEKDPVKWVNYWASWLDEHTFYISSSEITKHYQNNGFEIEHVEDRYIEHRLRAKGYTLLANIFSVPALKPFSRWVCRKYGGLVLLAKKSTPR